MKVNPGNLEGGSNVKISEQYGIIRDPKNLDDTKVPTMPILIFLDNGVAGEACTIRGAMAIVGGSKYFDCEDEVDEWNFRVEMARRESMKSIAGNVYAIVFDKNIGKVKENYADNFNKDDYEVEVETDPVQIHVESDRSLLLSLANLGSITILQREDCTLLTKWKNGQQACEKCVYNPDGKCDIYNMVVNEKVGVNCGCFYDRSLVASSVSGKEYINIADQEDLEELIGMD